VTSQVIRSHRRQSNHRVVTSIKISASVTLSPCHGTSISTNFWLRIFQSSGQIRPERVRQFRKCSLESVAGRLKGTVKLNETRNLELIKVHMAQGIETRKDSWKMYEGIYPRRLRACRWRVWVSTIRYYMGTWCVANCLGWFSPEAGRNLLPLRVVYMSTQDAPRIISVTFVTFQQL